MQTLRAIIVDDESDAIKNLKWEIEQFCDGVEVCDTFTDPRGSYIRHQLFKTRLRVFGYRNAGNGWLSAAKKSIV